jgi:hypothetical protein
MRTPTKKSTIHLMVSDECHDALPGHFLGNIVYREAWLSFEALDSGPLAAYAGSAIRGALGHLLRPLLCDGSGCGHDCQRPDACRYYSLFEQARTATGGNAPKPLIIDPPVTAELEAIALGGPVNLPFRSGAPEPGQSVPTLRTEHPFMIAAGTAMRVGIRLLGPSSIALAGIIEATGRLGLDVGGIRFVLRAVHDGAGRMLYDRSFPLIPAQNPPLLRILPEAEPARLIRIVFQTPVILKRGSRTSFDPGEFAAHFFEHSLARAVQVHNCLMGRPALPWMDAPPVRLRIVAHRLFRYVLPRRSYRQDKWMDFDGLMGYLDLAGDLDAGMPYARAAEILHFGQKATFGLGKVRVFVLE